MLKYYRIFLIPKFLRSHNLTTIFKLVVIIWKEVRLHRITKIEWSPITSTFAPVLVKGRHQHVHLVWYLGTESKTLQCEPSTFLAQILINLHLLWSCHNQGVHSVVSDRGSHIILHSAKNSLKRDNYQWYHHCGGCGRAIYNSRYDSVGSPLNRGFGWYWVGIIYSVCGVIYNKTDIKRWYNQHLQWHHKTMRLI